MVHPQNWNQSAHGDSIWCIPKIGLVKTCNFYEPDNVDNNENNTIVFKVSFAHATATSDETQFACYFASARSHDNCQEHFGTLMSSCLIAFLKDVSRVDYDIFVSEMVHVLAGKLGMPDDKISSFKFPFQVPQVNEVCNILFNDKTVKTEVLKYMIWCSQRSKKKALMARYVCHVLSWSGMENLVCIYKKLAMPLSPVLQRFRSSS